MLLNALSLHSPARHQVLALLTEASQYSVAGRDVTEKEVADVIAERTADQKLHREIIDTLRIDVFVRTLGLNPTLRKDVPDRMRKGFELYSCIRRFRFGDIVKSEMSFIERIPIP